MYKHEKSTVYVSEAGCASVFGQEAPNLLNPLNQAITSHWVFRCLYICYTMEKVQDKKIFICTHPQLSFRVKIYSVLSEIPL
jgi:hypothetical protein